MGAGASYPFDEICCGVNRASRKQKASTKKFVNASTTVASDPQNATIINASATCTASVVIDKNVISHPKTQAVPQAPLLFEQMSERVDVSGDAIDDALKAQLLTSNNIDESHFFDSIQRSCLPVSSEQSLATTLTSPSSVAAEGEFSAPRKHSPWVEQFLIERRLAVLLHCHQAQCAHLPNDCSSDRVNEPQGGVRTVSSFHRAVSRHPLLPLLISASINRRRHTCDPCRRRQSSICRGDPPLRGRGSVLRQGAAAGEPPDPSAAEGRRPLSQGGHHQAKLRAQFFFFHLFIPVSLPLFIIPPSPLPFFLPLSLSPSPLTPVSSALISNSHSAPSSL